MHHLALIILFQRSRIHHQRHRIRKIPKIRSEPKLPSNLQQHKHHRKSKKTQGISLMSSDGASLEHSRNICSCSQSSARHSFNAGNQREKENIAYNSPAGVAMSNQRDFIPRNSRSRSSNKGVNRSGERYSDNSSNELVQSRKSESKYILPTECHSSNHEKIHGTDALHSRISSKSLRKKQTAHNSRSQIKRTKPKNAVVLSDQGFVQHTLTSKFRTELKSQTEKEKEENIMPFIPSGSKVSFPACFSFVKTWLKHFLCRIFFVYKFSVSGNG